MGANHLTHQLQFLAVDTNRNYVKAEQQLQLQFLRMKEHSPCA
jgi:hypothetical protein